MAATYRPADAFDYVKNFLRKPPLEQIQAQLLDTANKMIWMAGPWRWSISTMTAIPLVSNQQDYNVTLPSDFLYGIHAYSSDGESATRYYNIDPTLPSTAVVQGQGSHIAITGAAGGAGVVRVYPAPSTLPTPTQNLIIYYKRQSPKITVKNMNTSGVLIMDDDWFWVYISGVLYNGYLYGDDPRAGTVQQALSDKGSSEQFTGARGVFEANIAVMKEREAMPIWMDKFVNEQKSVNK